MMDAAVREIEDADIVIIIGTSLNVYPAAGLLYYAPNNAEIYVIDPKEVQPISRHVHFIKEKAISQKKTPLPSHLLLPASRRIFFLFLFPP